MLVSYSIFPIFVILPIKKPVIKQKRKVVIYGFMLNINPNAIPANAECEIPTTRNDSFLKIMKKDNNPAIIDINIPTINGFSKNL